MSTIPTTSRPQTKMVKKKKEKPVLLIALGALSGVLVVALGIIFTQLGGAKSQIDVFTDGMSKLSEAAGLDAVTAETLADPAGIPAALEALSASVGEKVAEVERLRTDLNTQKVEAEKVAAERQTALDDLASAKKEASSLKGELDDKSKQLEDAQAKHEEELAAMRAKEEELSAQLAKSSAEQSEVPAGDDSFLEVSADETPAADEAQEEASSDEAPQIINEAGSFAIPDGESELFNVAKYNAESSQLTLHTVNGKKLVYTEVPAEVYDGLISAPVLDIFYRFQILEKFNVNADDVEVIRSIRL